MAKPYTDYFTAATDGLTLHARCYGPNDAAGPPIVCLPGLTRTAADFETLAQALIGRANHQRRVIAIDYRGRGLSGYDKNPDNYSLATELADLILVLERLSALPAIFVGTSRGGILTMLMASYRPGSIVAAVLNDIGPIVEIEGLMRIKSYVGAMPPPADFADAAASLRRLFGTQFPKLAAEDWLANASRNFKVENGRLVPTYDVNLAKTLSAVAADKPPPALWEQFDALAATPLMVIRGELSDLLSRQTVEAMRARRSKTDFVEVPDQGHAPWLADAPTIERIEAFIAAAESAAPQLA